MRIERNKLLSAADYGKVDELAINIDMVNGFVKKGALAAPSIMRVVPRQQEILDEYLVSPNKAIMMVRDVHKPGSVEFKTFGEHCIDGTEETEVIDELLKYYENSLHVKKNSTNFVFGDDFIYYIEELKNLKRVLLMGCLSDVCVKNGGITLRNYFDQNNRDVDIYVANDAIDTFDAPNHNADIINAQSIRDMEANGIKIYRKMR